LCGTQCDYIIHQVATIVKNLSFQPQGHVKVAFDPWLEWRMMGAAVGCGWVDGLTG